MEEIDWLKMKMFNHDTGYSGNDKMLDRRKVKLEHVWLGLGSHVTSAIKFDIQPFLRQALTDEKCLWLPSSTRYLSSYLCTKDLPHDPQCVKNTPGVNGFLGYSATRAPYS